MIPETGQHVKCMLRNNTIIEGIVEEWYGNYVKLMSLDKGSIFIIHHPEQDIILTKIVFDDDVAEDVKEPAEQVEFFVPSTDDAKSDDVLLYKDGKMVWTNPNENQESESLEEQFQQVYDQPSNDPDRIKRLAELRIEMAKADREIVAKQLKNHNIGEVKQVQYGYPGFIKKPRAQQHSAPQTQGSIGCRKQRPVDE